MWRVLGSALVSRRGQAVTIAAVALLASAAVAAVGWYGVAATQQVGVATVTGAPVDQRMVSVAFRANNGDPAPAGFGDAVAEVFPPGMFTAVAGGSTTADVRPAGGGPDPVPVNLAYREQVCQRLAVTGDCPATADEVLVPDTVADRLGVTVGDELAVTEFQDRRSPVSVVGLYRVVDPAAPYWGAGELAGPGNRPAADRETLFTPSDTLAGYDRLTHTRDVLAEPDAFATADVAAVLTDMSAGTVELRRQDYLVATTGLEQLLDRVDRERRNVTLGVQVGVAMLLLFTWFTLAVVLRQVVAGLRGDVGWWRLRGVPSHRAWLLAVGQSALPLLAGAVPGAVAGLAVGDQLTTIVGDQPRRTGLLLALALVGLVTAGGLVAVVASQLRTLRTPVRDLLRRVPARQGRWRRSLVDLALVTVAGFAVAQALLTGGADAGGLALLAPGLAVLALALAAAWTVPALAAGVARRALRAGRLATALTGASIARRPDTHRLFALVAVAVGLLTVGLTGWDATARDQARRAALEVGADRVVTVARVEPAELLAAVRAADPTGRAAMAVVHRPGVGDAPPVLAVDSTRLDDVLADWWEEYGGGAAPVADTLRPPAPRPVLVETDRLVLDAAAVDPARAPALGALLRVVDTGATVEVGTGPLTGQRTRYELAVPECAAGCRLVGLELRAGGPADRPGGDDPADGEPTGPAPGTGVDVFGLADATGAEVAPDLFTDPTRWRPALGPAALGPAVTGRDGGLRLTAAPSATEELHRDHRVFPVDAPAPLPVVGDWRPGEEARLAPLAGAAVPAEPTGTVPLVPYLGGDGVLVDLEYAQRLVPFPLARGSSQVWLSPTAPPSVTKELRAAGLTPVRVESRADRVAQLGSAGVPVGLRTQVAAALVGLVLATGAVLVVATAQRAGRTAELSALRVQGLSRARARAAGHGQLAAVGGPAIVVGVAAGLVGAVIARLTHPGFVDGWSVLPPAAPHPYPVVAAALAAVVAVGAAVLPAALAPADRIEGRNGGRS